MGRVLAGEADMINHQAHGPRNRRGAGAGIAFIRKHVSYEGDECLLWPLSCKNGYGMVGYLNKLLHAHRVMCELAHGKPPTRKHIAGHSCADRNPLFWKSCVNPNHLSWKTNSETQLE